MAEIMHDTGEDGSGRMSSLTKRAIKIDMTPMVDLAFLLLTFFILTTTFQKSRVLPLTMPDNADGIRPEISASNILNLVLAKNDKIYWWDGVEGPANTTDLSKNGIRGILLDRRPNEKLMVLIKPCDDSRFANVVDILDEMKITQIDRYAIVPLTEEDMVMIK